MAEVPIDPSALNSLDWYDGPFHPIELAEVPKSRAPSHISASQPNLFETVNDRQSLIGHGYSTSYATNKNDDITIRVASQAPIQRVSRNRRRKLQGWRFGVAVAAWAACTVMIMNLIFLIVALAKFSKSNKGGILTAIDGECKEVDDWATYSHIAINAISAVLLSASNYTMQATGSPTRAELDAQHARADFCDIGVPSVRNVFGRISRSRTTLWWILALSSIPIHLLYNSVVFKTLESNLYDALVVNTGFLKGDHFDHPDDYYFPYGELRRIQKVFTNDSAYTNSSRFNNLTNEECLLAYGTDFVSGHGNVLLITDTKARNRTDTLYSYASAEKLRAGQISYDWICTDNHAHTGCDIPTMRKDPSSWTINNHPIEYCISQRFTPHCKLEVSIPLLIVVIVMNACKTGSMFWVLWKQRVPTLVVIGDALTSFLDEPDELTKGRCLMGRGDIDYGPQKWRDYGSKVPIVDVLPKTYQGYADWGSGRWSQAVSGKRWFLTSFLIIVTLITAAALLGAGLDSLGRYIGRRSPFAIGFGKADPRAMINSYSMPNSLAFAVLLANLPQAVCSFLYLAYNSIFTTMFLSAEWSRYFLGPKKPLRVTTPRGQQRSTYYLQLPYHYSIPLIAASGCLHYLISESIFLVRVDAYKNGKERPGSSSSQIGYSCLPILSVILLGTTMLLILFGLALRKLHSRVMPVAGSCSVAIAAACHRPKDDVDAAYLPVSWGEVTNSDRDDAPDVYHCCFTSHEVQDLTIGRLYAGAGTKPDRRREERNEVRARIAQKR